ncbi:MAG: glutamine synthetase [Ignavibacteriales bacterium]|nr:glutamine synthetase [Ignavibacteriales bacterium]
MLHVRTLQHLVKNEKIETILVVFPDMYGRLMGKRVTAHFFADHILRNGMHACDYLLASDMEMTPVPGYEFASWQRGYGDFRLKPDPQSLRLASWLDKTAIVLCDVFEEEKDNLVSVAPRTILKLQMERARKKGYVPMGATEVEFFLFNDSYENAARKQYVSLDPAGSYIEDYHILQGTKEEDVVGAIRSHLERSGVPVENSKGEWGPGQQEINLRFSNFLEMSDRHVLYKQVAKEIAWSKGRSVTFMAKWNSSHAGSSMHIHASLWNNAKQPLFAGKEKLGPLHISPLFRWFLGGWMAHLQEMFPFFAPYPSSYKRYVAGSFAPTAIAWSYDNRTAGFRIIGKGPSLRIECRTPGADANPYLAFAATLAAGLDGIEKKTEPPPMFQGDVYKARELPQVPKTLHQAIRAMEQSRWARKTFGDAVINHYLHFFKTEQAKFDEAVTTWELARYFERA